MTSTPPPDSRAVELDALRSRLAELEAARDRDATTLRFLDAMSRVARVMRGTQDLDQMLMDVLDELLELLDCDRAWLLYPCDPATQTWGVPMERARPAWPGVLAMGVDIPNDAESSAVFAAALATDGPIAFDQRSGNPLPTEVSQRFHIQAQMVQALYPKTDRPWLLGIHHCARPHDYSDEDKRIFAGVCQRIADAVGTLVVLRDLRISERRFRTLVEHAPEAIVVMDAAGCFVDSNDKACALFSLHQTELLRRDLAGLSPVRQPHGLDSRAALDDLLERALAGEAPRFEWSLAGQDGHDIPCEIALVRLDGGPAPQVRGSIIDISQRRALEGQLLHLQKMQALGEMAGGVAHDFNNQLLVVLCHADMLHDLDHLDSRVGETADRIVHAAEEAARLTGQLLAFSRRSVLELRIVDLNDVLQSTASMLRRVVGDTVLLELDLATQPTLTLADRQQLTQVLVNLVSNARDAMPVGGQLTLRTHAVAGGPDDMDWPVGLPLGHYVALSVIDDGTGMDPAVRERVFEPFFTTKDVGRGTGLGLSTAYGVVQQSGGTIVIDSEPGQGTAFTVLLPRATGRPPEEESSSPVRLDLQGTETVLLVEDHETVADVATAALAAQGYTVHLARHPDEALALAGGDLHLDLLFTDIVMPGMDGVTLAERILDLRPGLPVLYTTGNSATATERLRLAASRVQLLEKPYTVQRLLQQVRKVLDR